MSTSESRTGTFVTRAELISLQDLFHEVSQAAELEKNLIASRFMYAFNSLLAAIMEDVKE